MTEDQIERIVCNRTDRIDARYMTSNMTEAEYKAELAALNAWAEQQYKLAAFVAADVGLRR